MRKTRTFEHQGVKGFKFGSNPLGTPKLFSHIYFVDGMLVDTGHSNMRKEVLKSLSELPVNRIFVTHHHEDHTGNMAALRAHFDVDVHGSAACIRMMKDPPAISLAQKMLWGERAADTNIKEIGTTVETPDHTFKVIPIPGHSADMVALYEAKEGWLFSADLYVHDYIRYFMRAESMIQQIYSIKKVLKLDFHAMFCGHNPQFDDPKARLEKKLQFLADFYGKAAALFQKGYTAKAILKAMGQKERWQTRFLSGGELSTLNMINAVIRDEREQEEPMHFIKPDPEAVSEALSEETTT